MKQNKPSLFNGLTYFLFIFLMNVNQVLGMEDEDKTPPPPTLKRTQSDPGVPLHEPAHSINIKPLSPPSDSAMGKSRSGSSPRNESKSELLIRNSLSLMKIGSPPLDSSPVGSPFLGSPPHGLPSLLLPGSPELPKTFRRCQSNPELGNSPESSPTQRKRRPRTSSARKGPPPKLENFPPPKPDEDEDEDDDGPLPNY
ncbi:MAG: hypothetical protein BGO67_01065 [Alphaproteobacteria bacterium 41-28]|nr:MAG: hypothetical protein BGO67_01065 [Alphaproteobacteria bacterium 41-28]